MLSRRYPAIPSVLGSVDDMYAVSLEGTFEEDGRYDALELPTSGYCAHGI
jgi:hypothetical protein